MKVDFKTDRREVFSAANPMVLIVSELLAIKLFLLFQPTQWAKALSPARVCQRWVK